MNILILGPQKRNENIIKTLREKQNKVLQTEDPINLKYLEEEKIEYLICNGYAPIVKKEIIDVFSKKIINIHPTYLPYGRGIYPLVWSLVENTPIGVSLHFIDEGIDSGDIIAKREVKVKDYQTISQVYSILLKEAEELFLFYWEKIISNKCETQTQKKLEAYRSRLDSENMVDLLPNLWESTVSELRIMHESYISTMNSVKLYQKEVHRYAIK